MRRPWNGVPWNGIPWNGISRKYLGIVYLGSAGLHMSMPVQSVQQYLGMSQCNADRRSVFSSAYVSNQRALCSTMPMLIRSMHCVQCSAMPMFYVRAELRLMLSSESSCV